MASFVPRFATPGTHPNKARKARRPPGSKSIRVLPQRCVYIVQPTGPIEDDPNLTNKRFPGNPTKSYRSRSPFRVVGKLSDWNEHSPEQLQQMRDHLENLKQQGIEAIEE